MYNKPKNMIDQNLKNLLVEAGLESSSTEIYLILAQKGELTVSELIKDTSLSRTTVHSALMDLLVKELVLYRKEGRNAYYKPAHPSGLMRLLEEKKRQQSQFEASFQEGLGSLAGMFNLANNRPGVRFYEGKEGVIEAYEEILTLGAPIESIEDKGEMAEFIPEYFPKFIQKRIQKKIFNKVVVPSSNTINVNSPEEFRETRSIDVAQFPFSMDIKICGNTVLLVTLKQKQAIAIRIDDPLIAENFKILFQFLWNSAAISHAPASVS